MYVKVEGEELREIRQRKGFERPELARISGIHEITIARLELGYNNSRLSTVKKLADALGVPPEDLLETLEQGKAVA